MTTASTRRHPAIAAAALALALACAGPAQAAGSASFARVSGHQFTAAAAAPAALASTDLVVNLAGIKSYDSLGTPINTVLTLDAQAGAVVDQLSWSLTLSTFGLSWLSEAAVLVTNSIGDGVYFNPGFGDDLSGSKSYADGGSLVSLGIDFQVLGDGKLFVEFYEDFDDIPGGADAIYLAGSLTLNGIAAAVPEPGSTGLMALGLFGVAFAARRRRRA